MHVAALHQRSPNSGKKCPLTRPLTTQNFVAIRQEVSEIYAVENLCSPKKWAKVHQNRLRPATPINQSKFIFGAIEILQCITVYASAQKAAREAYTH